MPQSRAIFFAALQRRFAVADGGHAGQFTLGHAAIDEAIGGLPRGRIHEIFAAAAEDAASAAGFALMFALRACPDDAPFFWIRQESAAQRGGHLYPPGLADLGADPDRILFVTTGDETATLRAAADILRSSGVGVALIEPLGKAAALNLTASRRLALAAEKSGVTAILLRGAIAPTPSAAYSRWQVRAAPSTPLAADAPGHPVFEIDLLRHRSGPSGLAWRVEWDRDRLSFREPPLSGAMVPLPARECAEAGEKRRYG